MSVILRLEGLSHRANSYDIRKFFVGLEIPHGGVHITGGPDGEAFVDVATWDNAYQALQMSGLQIKNSIIKISVVSAEEKQQALENCHKVKDSAHGRNGTDEKKSKEGREARSRSRSLYLRVDIGDSDPTPTDIRDFFDGVFIKDIVFSKDEESPGKVIVIIMFGSKNGAWEGYNKYKDSKILRIMWSDEKEWIKYGGKVNNDEDDCVSSTSGNKKTRSRSPRKSSRSPKRHCRSPQKHSRSTRRRSRSPRRRSPRRYSRSPLSSSRTPLSCSRSPASQNEEKDSTNPGEYHVQMTNLSYRAKRDDIKKLFSNHVRDDHIVFVYDERGHKTREGFATFTSKEHFKKALKLNNIIFKGHKLYISLISKSEMQKLLARKGQSSGQVQAYLYLRNFSPDVTKSDVKEFLVGFSLNEDAIFLLFDKKNTCLGDVLVKFSSLEETSRAEKLDRTTFKDKRIPLKVVYEDKLKSFLHSNGLHMMSTDPNECVTQEDDPSEDEITQENNTCDDEPITQDMDMPEEDCAVQKDIPPECVTQADD